MRFSELKDYIQSHDKSYDYPVDIDFGINEYEKERDIEEPSYHQTTKTNTTTKYTILHVAVEAGNLAAVRWLVDNGADVNIKKEVREKFYRKEYGRGFVRQSNVVNEQLSLSPFQIAMKNQDYAIAKILSERGALFYLLDYTHEQMQQVQSSSTQYLNIPALR